MSKNPEIILGDKTFEVPFFTIGELEDVMPLVDAAQLAAASMINNGNKWSPEVMKAMRELLVFTIKRQIPEFTDEQFRKMNFALDEYAPAFTIICKQVRLEKSSGEAPAAAKS